MMEEQKGKRELFSCAINLQKRVRSEHPLRWVQVAIEFKFVRAEVAQCYGKNGQVSVDPEVILKMIFLLSCDAVPSEPEPMMVIAERLDYLWFFGYGTEERDCQCQRLVEGQDVLGQRRLRAPVCADNRVPVWKPVWPKGAS